MRRLVFGSFVLSAALGANAAPVTGTDSSCLPVVDLGYVCHTSTKPSTTHISSNFLNNRNCIKPSPTIPRRKPTYSRTSDTPSLPLVTFDSELQCTRKRTERLSKPAPNCDSALKASQFGRVMRIPPLANTQAQPTRLHSRLGKRASRTVNRCQLTGMRALKKTASSLMFT